ncbi:MAG TPA: hypothetical protein VHP33_37595 [Polyangiaceae bacterium]|nr:hypothetical protein [Polyangiaceae bacterium]
MHWGQKLGHGFGLGVIAVMALACAGNSFKSAPDPGGSGASQGGVSHAGEAAEGGVGNASPTGGVSATGGGKLGFEAQPRPRAPLGGAAAGGQTGAGMAGSATADGGGGDAVQPPEEGSAGEPNIPEPPGEPDCTTPLADDWTAALGSAGSEWRVEFGDPRVDAEQHRLVVSFDDVAGRATAYQGGYYVTAEVTLEGGTVLTPYPYSNEMRWPSLRRSGSGVELGAAKYGSGEPWTTSDWPGFSGVVIAGTKSVTLTTYVKASSKAVAVKVSYGGHDYRSGWVSGFTWPQTNLGVMRYVGQNNSRVYSGDAVYVGPLRGCQKLTDAAVEAAFQD